MKPKYYNLDDLVGMIEEPNRKICQQILKDDIVLFKTVQGSSHNHQAWPGGYFDHIQEVMNIGLVLYNQLNNIRPLPFVLSDVLLILFLHDIEKPWKYEIVNGETQIKSSLRDKDMQREFRNNKLKEYGIKLTNDQEIGIKYVEGKDKDYSPDKRIMSPLSAICHAADVISARIWFEYPAQNDSWNGAKRTEN